MWRVDRVIGLAGLWCLLMIGALVPDAHARQPRLGFEGTLVRLPGHTDHVGRWVSANDVNGLRGYRVDRVLRGSAAARMGLERGDIVVYIGVNMAFTNHEGYRWAMDRLGDRAMIGVIDIRTNRLVWLCYPFRVPDPPDNGGRPPSGVVMVTLRPVPTRCMRRCSLCR